MLQMWLGLRRHVHGSHVIYYRVRDDVLVISRILGPGQDPTREFAD
jgi:plasmid stabilization system protein ParE